MPQNSYIDVRKKLSARFGLGAKGFRGYIGYIPSKSAYNLPFLKT